MRVGLAGTTVIGWAEHLSPAWVVTAAITAFTAAVVTSGHAVLYKRDDRGAMMWVGLIWAIPLLMLTLATSIILVAMA